jgi:hypothetical protein
MIGEHGREGDDDRRPVGGERGVGGAAIELTEGDSRRSRSSSKTGPSVIEAAPKVRKTHGKPTLPRNPVMKLTLIRVTTPPLSFSLARARAFSHRFFPLVGTTLCIVLGRKRARMQAQNHVHAPTTSLVRKSKKNLFFMRIHHPRLGRRRTVSGSSSSSVTSYLPEPRAGHLYIADSVLRG